MFIGISSYYRLDIHLSKPVRTGSNKEVSNSFATEYKGSQYRRNLLLIGRVVNIAFATILEVVVSDYHLLRH